MAKSWRGLRLIVVNGQRFRWICHFHYPIEMLSVGYVERGSSWAPDTLRIRAENCSQHVLRVTWPPCYGPIVKPRLVRVCIEEALKRGWITNEQKLTFAGVNLPNTEMYPPDHSTVEVVRDIISGRKPQNPKVRKLD